MKYAMMLSVLVALLLSSCEYESPLTTEHNIAVDSSVIGLWEPIPGEGEKPKQDERMMILKYSDTEYLIHQYSIGKDGLYYRAYPIKIDGVSCVQIQVIGTNEGPPKNEEKELFHVVSYQLMDGKLEIRSMNTDLIDDDLKTTDELREAFLKHKDNKDLFKYPGVFRKIKK